MRCNESLVGMSTLAMHNQQVSISATNNNLIPTLDVKTSNTKFQPSSIPPKENTIEVCVIQCRTIISILSCFKTTCWSLVY